jgi:LacI family transcriptional regulator
MQPPRTHTTTDGSASIKRLSPPARSESGTAYSDGRGTSRVVRERVRQVAERLGHPAPPDTTLLLVHSETPSFSLLPPALFQGLVEGARASNCRLEVAMVPDKQLDNEAGLQELVRERGATGLLLNYHLGFPRALPELIERLNLPAVWINSLHRHDCVMPGDFDAAVTVTRHLLALGHRRIAYADLTNDFTAHVLHHSCLERLDGYQDAMHEAGCEPQFIGVELPLDPDERRQAVHAALTATSAPTAVIAYCPQSLMPFYHHAVADLRLSVPGDLSLCSFVNDEVETGGLDLTRMANPWLNVGHAAVTRLVARCSQAGKRFDPLMLPVPLLPGVTCGRIRGTGRISREVVAGPR